MKRMLLDRLSTLTVVALLSAVSTSLVHASGRDDGWCQGMRCQQPVQTSATAEKPTALTTNQNPRRAKGSLDEVIFSPRRTIE